MTVRARWRGHVTLLELAPTVGDWPTAALLLRNMLRRLATLCALLLSLSGVIPGAVAYASQTQNRDCCSQSGPCSTEADFSIAASDTPSCCLAQPVPSDSTVAFAIQSDRRAADVPAPDAATALDFPNTVPFLQTSHTGTVATPIRTNQQQIYLHTARLRL